MALSAESSKLNPGTPKSIFSRPFGLAVRIEGLYAPKILRRLFSNFAGGAPGLGLLLLRLAAGIGLAAQGVLGLRGAAPLGSALLHILTIAVGLLLLVGLWTPIAGTMLAIIALVHAAIHLANPWTCVLMGILGAALALLGPGVWSVDARLFGWKRIRISDR